MSLRELRRHGLLVPDGRIRTATIRWGRRTSPEPEAVVGVTCHVHLGYGSIRLNYSVTQRDGTKMAIDEQFQMVAFPQPFGGQRLYLLCPATGKRCQCLYLPLGATDFRSRKGFHVRLQYRSQQVVKHYRLLARRQGVAKKILRLAPPEWEGLFDGSGPPPKPKWMRTRTYERLADQWWKLNGQAEAQFQRSAARMNGGS